MMSKSQRGCAIPARILARPASRPEKSRAVFGVTITARHSSRRARILEHFRVKRIRFTVEKASDTKTR